MHFSIQWIAVNYCSHPTPNSGDLEARLPEWVMYFESGYGLYVYRIDPLHVSYLSSATTHFNRFCCRYWHLQSVWPISWALQVMLATRKPWCPMALELKAIQNLLRWTGTRIIGPSRWHCCVAIDLPSKNTHLLALPTVGFLFHGFH